MVTEEPVNVSGRSHGLCVTGELDSGPWYNVFREITWAVCDRRVGPDV